MARTDRDLVESRILEHATSSPHRGRLDSPTIRGDRRNAICGDQITLSLEIGANGRVFRAQFEGRGCIISQAGASLLCEMILDRKLLSMLLLVENDLLEAIGLPLSPVRQQCALTAFHCLRDLLLNHAGRREGGRQQNAES